MQRQCSETLDKVHSSHGESRAVDLGDGNGFNFRAGPFCHYAADNSVSCIFCGEVAEWPGLDLMAENHNGANSPTAFHLRWVHLLCGVPWVLQKTRP